MCGSTVDIQSPTADTRQGKKIEEEEDRNHWAKIQWPALFHRAAIISAIEKNFYELSFEQYVLVLVTSCRLDIIAAC